MRTSIMTRYGALRKQFALFAIFDALPLASNGIKKFAMQAQIKDFGHGLAP
jgi:hypothetical protein